MNLRPRRPILLVAVAAVAGVVGSRQSTASASAGAGGGSGKAAAVPAPPRAAPASAAAAPGAQPAVSPPVIRSASPPPSIPSAATGAGGTSAPPTNAVVAVTGEAAIAARLAALRKKVLRDEDFVENDETNRDPFHSYMRLFVDRSTAKNRKVPAIFDKVALDELTLIAIVSGDETPRAMFRDATGWGQSVKKGDFLSRAGARVTKILSDRVIVELGETSGTGEARVIEKAILVNPGETR